MGFTPRQIREMSLWEFMMTVDGFKKANTSPEGEGGAVKPPTEAEFEKRIAALTA